MWTLSLFIRAGELKNQTCGHVAEGAAVHHGNKLLQVVRDEPITELLTEAVVETEGESDG